MNPNELHNSIISNTAFTFVRSGGKGGQNANKVNTKVHATLKLESLAGITADEKQRLVHKLYAIINKDGCIFIDVDEERYQERNRAIALSRLESKIVAALKKQKKRIKTKPSKESNERRLKSKRIKSEIKRNRQAFK